ncbi:hypothetical protein [Mycolicibacterium sp. P1-18]|uniref:hypothetical protein n=1 Tax=Mycolicibacterium sp. P1-18 TaxID=2024615 RepID=UPI0011F21713|nr:hypothetical protein [Mycolicibacterium sp. P1-18]
MLPAEARWFGTALDGIGVAELTPVLNLGSSTQEFRTVAKPHIELELFGPLEARGVRVVHSDLKQDDGVQIAGDFSDRSVQQQIAAVGVRSIMCNNMLEHVADIKQVCSALSTICPPTGRLFLSVPCEYPYHPDPIDNGFRPDIERLKLLLDEWGFDLELGEVVHCGGYAEKVREKPQLLLRDLYLLLIGAFRPGKFRMLRENYRFWRKEYTVSCAVFTRR